MAYHQPRNRRRSERYPAEILVCIFHRGERVGEYWTRDVSQGGIGLYPGKIMFWRGTRLEVQLFSPSRGRAIARRVPAIVRHCGSRGMGLKFRAGELLALP